MLTMATARAYVTAMKTWWNCREGEGNCHERVCARPACDGCHALASRGRTHQVWPLRAPPPPDILRGHAELLLPGPLLFHRDRPLLDQELCHAGLLRGEHVLVELVESDVAAHPEDVGSSPGLEELVRCELEVTSEVACGPSGRAASLKRRHSPGWRRPARHTRCSAVGICGA